jgi:hypothetical protein
MCDFMGIEILMKNDLEKGAEILEFFMRKRYSEEMDYDVDRASFASTYIIMGLKHSKNEELVDRTKEILRRIMNNYMFDVDKDQSYLYELTTVSTFYRIPETTNFLEKIKQSNDYIKLNDNLKDRVERCVFTFEQEKN